MCAPHPGLRQLRGVCPLPPFPHLPARYGGSNEDSEKLIEPQDRRHLDPWACGTNTLYSNSDDNN